MLGDMFASLALEPQHDLLGGFSLINHQKREFSDRKRLAVLGANGIVL